MGSQPRLLSASRAAAVLGVSEWSTQREVWQTIREELDPGWNARHGYTLPPPPDSAAIRWGTAFEDAVCELAEANHPDGRTSIIHRELEFLRTENGAPMTCHIDGEYVGGRGLHEGKTTTAMAYRAKWGEEGTDRIPASYQAQVQHQMLVTGAGRCIVSVLVFPEAPEAWEKLGWTLRYSDMLPGLRGQGWIIEHEKTGYRFPRDWAQTLTDMGYFHQYPVEANPGVHAVMLEKYREFWDRYILGDEIPPATNLDDARRLFPEPVGTLVCDDQTTRWLAEFAAIRDEIGGKGPLAKRKDELQTLVLEAARTQDRTIDDDTKEKTILLNAEGKKLGQWDGKTFRVN